MTIKLMLVLQIVNCFLMTNTSFANFTDVHKETDNAAIETTEAGVIYTTTDVKHTPTSTYDVNSEAFSADSTGVQYSEIDGFLKPTTHEYVIISEMNNINSSHEKYEDLRSDFEFRVPTDNHNSVFGYFYVEPVNCSACDEDGISYEVKNYNYANDFLMNNIERSKIGYPESMLEIKNKMSELNNMEKVLFDLYNEMILASSRYACKLNAEDGLHAMNVSKKYAEIRSDFIDKMIDLDGFINDPNNPGNKNLDLFGSDMNFPEIIMYEKNLNFSKNLTRILELLSELSRQGQHIENGKELMNTVADHTKSYSNITLLTKTVRELKHLEEIHNTSAMNIQQLQSIVTSNKMLKNIFNTSAISCLVNLEELRKKLINTTLETDFWTLNLDSKKSVAVLYEKVEVILIGIIFLVGIAGNGLLLIVCIRHKELRSTSNIMVTNIVIADILFLIVSVPIFYSTDRLLDDVQCKVYHYIRSFCVGVCVYSLVTLSIQRSVALTLFFRREDCLRKIPKWILIILILIIGGIVAIPYGLFSGVESDGSCYDLNYKEIEYRKGTSLFDLIFLCAIPLCLISLLYGITVDTLSPDSYFEGVNIKAQYAALKSDVVVGLFVVFSISYLPFYMFRFAFVWSDTKVDILHYEYILYITPFLMYLNSCLNPVALYISSKRYRSYFNVYLLCGRGKSSLDVKNISTIASNETVVSSL